MDDETQFLGLALRHLRNAKGISQTQAAANAKVTKAMLSAIERGKIIPRVTTLCKILKGQNLTLRDLGSASLLIQGKGGQHDLPELSRLPTWAQPLAFELVRQILKACVSVVDEEHAEKT